MRAPSAELNIPTLRTWGVTEADLPGVAEKSAKASSMQATATYGGRVDSNAQGSAVGAVNDKHTRFPRLNLFQGIEGLLWAGSNSLP